MIQLQCRHFPYIILYNKTMSLKTQMKKDTKALLIKCHVRQIHCTIYKCTIVRFQVNGVIHINDHYVLYVVDN